MLTDEEKKTADEAYKHPSLEYLHRPLYAACEAVKDMQTARPSDEGLRGNTPWHPAVWSARPDFLAWRDSSEGIEILVYNNALGNPLYIARANRDWIPSDELRKALEQVRMIAIREHAEQCKDARGRQFGKIVDICDAALSPSQTETDGWISVSERLPEINDEVWVWTEFHNSDQEYGDTSWLQNDGTWAMGSAKNFTVTHWQPLPAPPRLTPEPRERETTGEQR